MLNTIKGIRLLPHVAGSNALPVASRRGRSPGSHRGGTAGPGGRASRHPARPASGRGCPRRAAPRSSAQNLESLPAGCSGWGGPLAEEQAWAQDGVGGGVLPSPPAHLLRPKPAGGTKQRGDLTPLQHPLPLTWAVRSQVESFCCQFKK